jgi:quinol monooxygenase YgiN
MNRIQSIGRMKIHPGKLEAFKRLSAECVRLAREKDPGTIRYDIFLNAEGTEAVVYEEYESSEALLAHFANMGENADAIFAIVDMEGELWGEPSDALRAGIEPYGVRVLRPLMRLTED